MTLPNLADLSWLCMVCGDERPDEFIHVAHRPVPGLEDGFPDTRVNVRYCTDRAGCISEAHAPGPWRHINPPHLQPGI